VNIHVFGITGTNGKTTVSYILRNILKTSGKKCDLIGTISHQIGEHEYEAINTTPSAKLLEEFFLEMKEAGTQCCVMEVSSHALIQGRIDHISINYAGFTNLTQDHLDYHKEMEEYYQAKKKLFIMSKSANVINIDDFYGKRLYGELMANDAKALLSYSMKDKKADFYGEICEKTEQGTLIHFYERGAFSGDLIIKTPGVFSVYNGLLAAGLARAGGVAFEHIAQGMQEVQGVPGRFEVFYGKKGETAIVDFAHTPDALENLLKEAQNLKKNGRLISVFGCGGNRDRGKRKIMGRVAGSYSDYVIVTSDNPRQEDPEDIAAEIEEGVYDTGCDYHVVIDRYQAIKRAVSICRKGDIIVIAGKGHEAYQIIGNQKKPFDDRQIVREELEK